MAERAHMIQLLRSVLLLFLILGYLTLSFAKQIRSKPAAHTAHANKTWETRRASAEDSDKNGSLSRVTLLESSLTVITHSIFEKHHQFCKLKGVCRTGDGTIVAPRWMESYSEYISKCGLGRILFSLNEKEHEDGNFTSMLQDDSEIVLKDNFRDFDVIGNRAPRGEQGLLATDMTPSLLLMDLFARPEMYSKMITTLCATKEGKLCKAENYSDPSNLHPLILVDSRVAESKDFRWPKSLLRLIRNSMRGTMRVLELKDLYGWRVRSEASCFRSVISTNVIASDIPSEAILHSHIFFSRNRLSRQTVNASSLLSEMCSAKVLILNRYGKRFIEGSEKLALAISSLGQEVRRRDPKIVIQPEVVFFDNSSFHEQVSVMQETSVVIASHGDENANFMFLRPMARVFEILPFGLRSDLYKNLSKIYGSIYSDLVGQPDEDVFLACVEHFNPEESEGKKKFIAAWKLAAQNFRAKTVRKKANVQSGYVIPEDDDDGARVRDQRLRRLHQCASYQRIAVDVKHLANTVTMAAAKQCHFKGGY